ncbi:MAG: TIGR03905 family TSCPD domain-containing protein [Lachnospiraceae bacterium]|nr:TIGR03905 family TSCPD domain-containing protein [Lachnospiraceae bacterium]
MDHYDYKTKGTCAVQIHFDIDDDKKIRNVRFDGGCNGNLKAISTLIEGMDAAEVSDKLYGNLCGMRGTSCADQLARGIREALA